MSLGKVVINLATKTGAKSVRLQCARPNKLANEIGLKLISKPTTVAKENVKLLSFGERIEQASQFENFANFKIFQDLSMAEKRELHSIITKRNNFNVFLATLRKDKPACLLGAVNQPLQVLNKCKSGRKIDFVHVKPFSPVEGHTLYNTYMINRNSVQQIIKKNKELFTVRLGLPKDSKISDIYSKVLETLENRGWGVQAGEFSDLEGIILGFPKQNAMIYNLECKANATVLRVQENVPEYKEKLLNLLHSDKSPYKNLSQEEIDILERAIKNIPMDAFAQIGQKGSYTSSIYEFIKYVDEPGLTRVSRAIKHFEKDFNVEDII